MSSWPSDMEHQQAQPMLKERRTRVVIVGAGFAGVAAAAALREGGVDDVIVLEAQNRPGGRVHKLQLEGGFVETGAQFIHGERGNALYELVEKYGLLLETGQYQNGETSDSSAEDYRNHHFVTSEGRLLPPERVAPLLRAANQIFRNYANSFFVQDTFQQPNHTVVDSNRKPSTQNVSNKWSSKTENGESQELAMSDLKSPSDYIINYGRCVSEVDGTEEHTFAKVLRMSRERILEASDEPEETKLAVLKWMEQWEYTDNAARLHELSLQAYGKYGYIPGYGLTVSCSGLEDVFKVFLSDSLPQDALHLNTPVKTIFWAEQSSERGAQDGQPDRRWNQHSCQESEGESRPRDSDTPQQGLTRDVNSHGTDTMTSDNQNDHPQTQHRRPIKIVCENGGEYRADHVIVTSSVGYLRKNEATLFRPALPEKTREAVHQMGFGVVAKVFLVWEDLNRVLDAHVEGVQLLWVHGKPVRPPSDRSARKTQNGGNWYDFLQGFERVDSHKDALMTWLAGEEAEIMGELPGQEVKDVLFELMLQFLGNPCLPPPKDVVRSLWHSNPYILGSYSYIPVQMDPDSHDLLSLPLPSLQNPVLQLSEEATSRRFYSSVHGAIDSGRRAARVILRHHQPRHHTMSEL